MTREIKNNNYKNTAMMLIYEIKKNSYSGIDPSSIKFSKNVLSLSRRIEKSAFVSKKQKKMLKNLMHRAIFCSGHLSLRFTKPQKQVYSKGLALLLSGCANDLNNYNDYIDEISRHLLKRRLKNCFMWSHDVNYYFPGNILISSDIPNLVTTSFVANAFYDLYLSSKDNRWLYLFDRTVKDIIKHIPYRSIDNNKICFMYTPITNYHVHNANLLCAELLAKSIDLKLLPESIYLPLIKKSLIYSLDHFDSTSSYPYAGPPTENYAIDNYHTGYVLRSLSEIQNSIGSKILEFDMEKRIARLLKFYTSNFIDKYVLRSLKNRRTIKIVESHSLAESILIYCNFFSNMPEMDRNSIASAIDKSINLLYDGNSHIFFNKALVVGGLPLFIDKTDMVRWSNSWMFYALTSLENFNTNL